MGYFTVRKGAATSTSSTDEATEEEITGSVVAEARVFTEPYWNTLVLEVFSQPDLPWEGTFLAVAVTITCIAGVVMWKFCSHLANIKVL